MKRKTLYWIIGIAGALMLAGVVYLVVQLTDPQKLQGKATTSQTGEMTTRTERSTGFEGAAELPDERPAASGIIIEIIDNRMPITSLDRIFTTDAQGRRTADSRLMQEVIDNPITDAEIVVTKDTQILMDVTDMNAATSDGTYQQVVEQITMDDVQPKGVVTVWGEKHGERIIAKVILYRAQ